MQGGPPPFVICSRCATVLLGRSGYCPRCGTVLAVAAQPNVPAYAFGLPPQAVGQPVRYGTRRWWRRTRAGLLVTALGLVLVWLPWVSVVGALFISLGSTLVFLGARRSDRPHRVAVGLAFLAFAIGAVVILLLLGAFLVHAFQIAGQAPMSALRDEASTLQWGSLPGTAAIALGLALQVNFLVGRRERAVLYGLTAALVATAFVATLLAEPEIAALDATVVRTGPVLDLLSRLSLYRIVEAPAYLGLAIVYLFAHRSDMERVVRAGATPLPNAP